MSVEWYYQLMGEEIGPLSASALKEKAATGDIQWDTFIRKGRDGQWVSAWRVKGLFDKTKKFHTETTSKSLRPNVTIKKPMPPPIVAANVAIKEIDSAPASANTAESQPATKSNELPSWPLSNRKKSERRRWIIAVLVIIAVIPAYSWIRNNGLRNKLKSCETYGVIKADVYYDEMFSNDVVVFDFKGSSLYGARRIDTVHIFLQFASKLDYIPCVVLFSPEGVDIFFIYTRVIFKE